MGITRRVNLEAAIVEALPLDFVNEFKDITRLRLIVRTILKSIRKGLERDGFVTIEGLGRFYMRTRPAHFKQVGLPYKTGTVFELREIPEKNIARFRACYSIRRALDTKEE